MARKFGTKNVIKIDPLAYNLGLLGLSGIGKSTLAKEVCESLVGEDGYLIANCGLEDGVDAIAGAMYVDIPDWDTLEEFVEDVMDNRLTDYKDLKVIVWDTIDELFRISEPEVIRLHNREYPEKPVKSIKAAFGGFMAGEDKVVELILEKLWGLKKIGISMFIIGHTKKRTMTDPVSNLEYDMLTTNMSGRYFNAIQKKLHILGVGSIDREIVQEKTGKKVGIGKVKQDEIKGRITSEARKITFRDDNFSIDSKSRFSNIIDCVEFDSKEFIEAVKDAIRAEHERQDVSKPIEEVAKEQAKAKEKIVEKSVADNKDVSDKKELDRVLADITSYVKAYKSKPQELKPLLEKTKALGYTNPTKVDNLEHAKEILELTK